MHLLRTIGLLGPAIAIGGAVVESHAVGLEAEVRRTPAGPTLYVNGKPMTPSVLFVNLHDVADPVHTPLQLGEVEAAGRHGVNIVSLTIGTPWPAAGETPDYAGAADHWIEMALKANPKALLIPRILTTAPSDAWFAAHPDERMLYDDGARGLPSVHSQAWRRDAARHVAALVRHLEAKFGDHILAYHPSGQHTGEWFYDRMWEGRTAGFEPPAVPAFRAFLRARYRTDAALRRAWGDAAATLETAVPPTKADQLRADESAFRDPATQRQAIDFDDFRNTEMADTVAHLCRAIKQAAPRKLTVAFYGYHFELAPAQAGMSTSGHLALGRLLRSPDVDILCSPVSYWDRGIGGGGYFMAPIDSIQLHGKLWLVEDDTRTHLSPLDAGYERPVDFRQTRGVLARNFAHVATRGTAVWWMDLPGQGWFAGDEMWQYLGTLDRAYTEALAKRGPYRPEVAVVIDEQSPLFGAPNSHAMMPLLYLFRAQWYRIGAPTGIYLLEDLLSGKTPPAKLTIILNAFRLTPAQRRTLQRRASRKGCVTLFMYAPGYIDGNTLSVETISETVGMAVRRIEPRTGAVVDAPGKTFPNAASMPAPAGAYSALTPSFAVDDAGAQTLATYAVGGEVAVASKPLGEGLSVYSGALVLPAGILCELARKAGVHLYSEQGDIVMAGGGWVALHATEAGTRTIRLPRAVACRDAVTGEAYAPATTLSFEMQKGDTKLLRL
jgi:hypothetical protein